VPVGKDQIQHVEITRDLAQKFNNAFGDIFKLPTYKLREDAEVLPGVDGQKMSKSYGNDIDPFMPEKPLRKRIMKIKTDSTPVDQPKDPESCTVFQIFRGLAGRNDPRTLELEERYRKPGMGYGEAKQALFELILDLFGEARKRREDLMRDPGYVDEILAQGAQAAQAKVAEVTDRARRAAGL